MDIFVIDAFTDQHFKGNSAAIMPVTTFPDASLMQRIAAENNLSETAFIKPTGDNTYAIRWFSPLTEIDFCGHATLASAFVLYQFYQLKGEITFTTEQVGTLTVKQATNGNIEMNFPCQPGEEVEPPAALLKGLSITPIKVLKNRQAYIAVLPNEQAVHDVICDSELLKQLAPHDIVVTAQSSQYDFVSRYFWPANGGYEDPVTGSIHTALAPYWAQQLNKRELTAYQASQRGGVLHCKMIEDDRIIISGSAVLYLRGKVYL
ncbi:PhzF family phenazine biosynthesis protein [Photobacterium leiognathi]|uniref:PhzF family phenazine biosynthesis protein n=1 Tax=Photobacterium leiognathi TaxID=553611 RepID=UPI0027343F44|nr:PhzF family phenazine biosynthesis protein [Photobacterium leiognathi]